MPATATKGEKSVRLPGNSSENWKQARGDGGVGIDGVIEHAEAVLGAQPLVLRRAGRRLSRNVEREPHGVERGAP